MNSSHSTDGNHLEQVADLSFYTGVNTKIQRSSSLRTSQFPAKSYVYEPPLIPGTIHRGPDWEWPYDKSK